MCSWSKHCRFAIFQLSSLRKVLDHPWKRLLGSMLSCTELHCSICPCFVAKPTAKSNEAGEAWLHPSPEPGFDGMQSLLTLQGSEIPTVWSLGSHKMYVYKTLYIHVYTIHCIQFTVIYNTPMWQVIQHGLVEATISFHPLSTFIRSIFTASNETHHCSEGQCRPKLL